MIGKALQGAVREFVRALGVLSEDRTPCGAAIPPREAHAVLLLAEHAANGVALCQTDLQQAVGIDKSNIARLVQRLSERGWISQKADRQDGRRRVLGLTARGRSVAASLEQRSDSLFAAVWQKLEPAEREEVTGSLERLSRALRAVAAQAVGSDEEVAHAD